MDAYIIISALIIGILFILYYFEKNRRAASEKLNKRLQDIIGQLDSQAKIIIKTDLALNKAQEELDKKITGLYTLHELGKEISSTFNIENLFGLINQPFVLKLGFSKLLIMLKNDASGMLATKSSTGYSEAEIKTIESELNKRKFINALFKKEQSVIVNRENESIGQEYNLLDILNVESFITAPIIVKDEPVGFILMGNASVYGKTIEGDSELLSILAGQIGIAIENTKLYTELFGSHKELERRVAERTQELEKLNEELKNLNKMKSDFISAVSHELRTPLAISKEALSLLLRKKVGALSEQQEGIVSMANANIDRLGYLINDILDASKINADKMMLNKEMINVVDLVKEVFEAWQLKAKTKHIQFTLSIPEEPLMIDVDKVRFMQILSNLVSNAIKFTLESGKVDLVIEEMNDMVKFIVRDNGIGIEKEDISKIFQKFQQLQRTYGPGIQGTGLGLNITKSLVELHGGQIFFNSEVGKGTTFAFTIPKKRNKDLG